MLKTLLPDSTGGRVFFMWGLGSGPHLLEKTWYMYKLINPLVSLVLCLKFDHQVSSPLPNHG